jgi:ribulose kinase
MLGASVDGMGLPCEGQAMTSRLALICGTSSCHMAVSTILSILNVPATCSCAPVEYKALLCSWCMGSILFSYGARVVAK